MPAMTYKMDMDQDGTLVPVQYEDDAGRVPDGLADNQDHGWIIDSGCTMVKTVSDMAGYRQFGSLLQGWTDVEIARMAAMVTAMRSDGTGTTTNEWLREYNLMP